MDIDIEAILEGSQRIKEMRVADAFEASDKPDWDDLDLRPTLLLLRGGREVATLFCRDRNHALRGVRHSVPAFGADGIAFIMDAFMAKRKWFTDRKRGPKPNELGRMLRERGRDDLVTEGMNVVWADRTGLVRSVSIDFALDFATKAITWGELDHVEEDENFQLKGAIPDEMRNAFDLEQHLVTLRSLGLNPADFNLTDEQARLEADIATARVMVRLGFLVRLACYSEEDGARVRESIESDQNLGYYSIGPDGETKHRPAMNPLDN
jgi:hypothetical protein